MTFFLDNIVMLQRFLNEYDYLSTSRSGNHDVQSAIKDFQRFAGLEVICELDQPTIRLMKTPRCGNPDDAAVNHRIRCYSTGDL